MDRSSNREVIDLTLEEDDLHDKFSTPPSISRKHPFRDVQSKEKTPLGPPFTTFRAEPQPSVDENRGNGHIVPSQTFPAHIFPSSDLAPQLAPKLVAQYEHGPDGRKRVGTTVLYPGLEPSATFPSPMENIRDMRSCTFCSAQGEAASCDGGLPCSACVEPNPDGCEYLDEQGRISSSSQGLRQNQYHGKRFLDTAYRGEPPDSPPNSSQAETSDDYYSDVLSSDAETVPSTLPFNFNDVKLALKQYEDKMRAHREYLLQPLIAEATILCQQEINPNLKRVGSSPFTELVSRREGSTTKDAAQAADSMQLFIKTVRGTGPKRFFGTKIKIQRIANDEKAPILPKYRSIGRLGGSFLTKNVHTLKYMPYFAEDELFEAAQDEKEAELKQRYKSDDDELIKQRKCREMVLLWKPWILDFLLDMDLDSLDILYYLTLNTQLRCKTCDTKSIRGGKRQAARLQQMLQEPSEEDRNRAAWCCMGLLEVASIGIWHVLEELPEIRDIIRQTSATDVQIAPGGMCSVCLVYGCPTHGAYVDADDDSSERSVLIDDSEAENNIKEPAKTGLPKKEGKHQCGFYCVPGYGIPDSPTIFKGRRADGTIGGFQNPDLRPDRGTDFAENEICSDFCFWEVRLRETYHQQHPDVNRAGLTKTEQLFVRKYLGLYSDNPRAPCMIARLARLRCMTVFYEMVAVTYSVAHISTPPIEREDEDESSLDHGGRKLSRLAAGFDTSNSRKLDARKPFVPCAHEGPCLDCSCAQDNIHCEFFCGCDENCKRRFQGCRCRNRVCFNDDRCDCWMNNRECDPWLCGNCGVIEVLDPNNKYRDEIREGRCQNNRIQLDLPARTIKAPSEVQGWGLYAGQDLETNTFIGEYKGEIISVKEGDRRGVVYHNIGQEYLFNTNTDHEIDGSRFGNKTRFMNNSQLDKNINVLAKNLFSNGIQRIMFYTKRPVKAGEELLYNYNYPDHVVKHFWERGEKPADKQGVVTPAVVRPRMKGRFVKLVAGKNDGEESTARKYEQAQMQKGKAKKRAQDDSPSDAGESEVDFFQSMAAVNAATRRSSDESDYEDSEGIIERSDQESSNDEDDEGDEDDAMTGHDQPRRRRKIFPADRRRGGLAQKRAWETRRKNSQT